MEQRAAAAERLRRDWTLRTALCGMTLSSRIAMNPDKLFDYLEGRLAPEERAALEEQLVFDKQLQRELAVARRIHAAASGDSQEVVLPAQPQANERGRKIALRLGVAFIALMALNVGFGLWLIARHETNNPNRPLLEAQMREQITKSLEHAAAAFTPDPDGFGVSEVMIRAGTGKLNAVGDRVVAIASRLGGSAAKGLQEGNRLTILIDLPANRESEFRAAVSSIADAIAATPQLAAHQPGSTPSPPVATPAPKEKKSFVVQIVEAPSQPK